MSPTNKDRLYFILSGLHDLLLQVVLTMASVFNTMVGNSGHPCS